MQVSIDVSVARRFHVLAADGHNSVKLIKRERTYNVE